MFYFERREKCAWLAVLSVFAKAMADKPGEISALAGLPAEASAKAGSGEKCILLFRGKRQLGQCITLNSCILLYTWFENGYSMKSTY
jgi:hypothetical protein